MSLTHNGMGKDILVKLFKVMVRIFDLQNVQKDLLEVV